MRHYHTQRRGRNIEFSDATILICDRLPIHFGFLDAWVSGDGLTGHVRDADPNATRTIFASDNIFALDWVAGEKMQIDPLDNAVVRRAIDVLRRATTLDWGIDAALPLDQRVKRIELAEKWFDKYGLKATLFLRCVPIARTFISLPAGIYKANFWVFLLYSLLGSLPWCYLWATIGYKLGENWSKAQDHMKILDYIVLAILVYLLYRFLRYRFKRAAETTSEAS